MDDSYRFSTSGLYKSFGYDPDAPYDSYTEYIASLPINPVQKLLECTIMQI